MAVKRHVVLPSFSTTAQGQTAVCNIPVGPRYHQIQISGQSGTGKLATDHIKEIRLKVNGKQQRQATYAELQALNVLNGAQYGIQGNGATASAFQLPIFLAEPWRKSNATQDLLAWATGNVDSFQLEVDLGSPTVEVASLRATALIDNSIVSADGKEVQQPMGAIVKWFRTVIPAPATNVDINFGAINNRDNYQSIRFVGSGITSYKVFVDGFCIREASKAENDALLVSYGLTPISGALDIVFDADDIINNYLPMIGRNGERVQDFRIQLTSSSALTSVTALAQVLGPAD